MFVFHFSSETKESIKRFIKKKKNEASKMKGRIKRRRKKKGE